eukprot:2123951-Pyramimonas_sp.AAC.1
MVSRMRERWGRSRRRWWRCRGWGVEEESAPLLAPTGAVVREALLRVALAALATRPVRAPWVVLLAKSPTAGPMPA